MSKKDAPISALTSGQILDLSHTIASKLFSDVLYPFEVLPKISDFIKEYGNTLSEKEYKKTGSDIWISKKAKVAETAHLSGPLIICEGAEIRHCAFIRGSVIVGKDCVVGNSTELKNVILFDGVQVPHYNYVGDSILGYKAHMGAGSITSNVKSDKTYVEIKYGRQRIKTGLKKFGAVIGDRVEIGCGSILNPGSVIGRDSMVYPLSSIRGYVPNKSIYKVKTTDIIIEKKD